MTGAECGVHSSLCIFAPALIGLCLKGCALRYLMMGIGAVSSDEAVSVALTVRRCEVNAVADAHLATLTVRSRIV